MAFSVDLRERVMAAVDGGMRKTKAAEIFNISRTIIYDWVALRANTNSLAPKSGYQKGHSHKITDWAKFELFAYNNSHRTAKWMAAEWAKIHDIVMSDDVMERALKKINYTVKKKRLITPRRTKSNVKII